MKSREEQIKEFFSDAKNLKALVNNEKFIDKVSGGKATTETYKDELGKLGLEISTDEAKQIESTVNKLFEMPTEKIKLDDEFLKDIAGGKPASVQATNAGIDNNGNVIASAPSSKGPSGEEIAFWGLSVGIPVAAWFGSGIGCAIAASVYRKKKNKDKFHKCATAAFHILNAPLFPFEVGATVVAAPAIAQSLTSEKDAGDTIKAFFTNPVEEFFGVDVE